MLAACCRRRKERRRFREERQCFSRGTVGFSKEARRTRSEYRKERWRFVRRRAQPKRRHAGLIRRGRSSLWIGRTARSGHCAARKGSSRWHLCSPLSSFLSPRCSALLPSALLPPRIVTAAIHMDNPYCSCELRRPETAAAYSCMPYGESLLQL